MRPPFQPRKRKQKIFAANGSKGYLFVTVYLTVLFGLKRHFSWQFKRASVQFPVIGMYFLR